METYTVNEVIQITIDLLNGISVPRKLNEQIGIPIDNAVNNLLVVLQALEQKPEEPAEEEDGTDGRMDQDG
jgi:hypothetical protein